MPPADGRSLPPSAPRPRSCRFPHRRILPDMQAAAIARLSRWACGASRPECCQAMRARVERPGRIESTQSAPYPAFAADEHRARTPRAAASPLRSVALCDAAPVLVRFIGCRVAASVAVRRPPRGPTQTPQIRRPRRRHQRSSTVRSWRMLAIWALASDAKPRRLLADVAYLLRPYSSSIGIEGRRPVHRLDELRVPSGVAQGPGVTHVVRLRDRWTERVGKRGLQRVRAENRG
jgi:hypothetical protein